MPPCAGALPQQTLATKALTLLLACATIPPVSPLLAFQHQKYLQGKRAAAPSCMEQKQTLALKPVPDWACLAVSCANMYQMYA
jgi:hypothetical protein